jgi:hypothetical protein
VSRAQGCAGATQLKTPYRDGTTHVIFEPLDFIARLAALVPKPRVNLTRFHGIFAPNSKHRAQITPARRGRGGERLAQGDSDEPTPADGCGAIRVFGIHIELCPAFSGAVCIIACLEDAEVIDKILTHLDMKGREPEATRRWPSAKPAHGAGLHRRVLRGRFWEA